MNNISQQLYRRLQKPARGIFYLAFAVFAILILPIQLNAEPVNDALSGVATYTASIDGTADSWLIELIQPSLVLEMERAGFPVVAYKDDPPEPGEHFATLLCYVSTKGENIVLEMVFASEERPELNSRSTQEGKIDLGFDALIARGVSQILDHVLALAPEYGGREPVFTDEDERVVIDLPTDEGSGGDSDSQPDLTDPQPDIQGADADKEEIPFKPFKISVGAAPFIVVGRVNLYFSLGVFSSLRGGYTFRTRAGDIETGLFVGLNYFTALGLETRSFNFLLPMGVSLRYGGHFGKRLQAFLTVTGGPALFILKPEETPQLIKITGYAGAGAGAGFLLGKRLGLTLEVAYMVFFEQYYPIMGVVPSIYFDIRL